MDFDKIDRSILRVLQEDGRLQNNELADRVGLSASACLRRVKSLEKSGIIQDYVMRVDPNQLGYGGSGFVHISLKNQTREVLDAFEEAVVEIPEVMECYLLAGQSDYIVRVIFKDLTDFERLHVNEFTRLPHVDRIHTTFTLRKVVRKTSIPV